MKKYIALFFVICLSSCSIKEQISEDYLDKDEQTEHSLSTNILSSVSVLEQRKKEIFKPDREYIWNAVKGTFSGLAARKQAYSA